VIGILCTYGSSKLFAEVVMPAFSKGLKDAGFVEGKNISIEIRDADGHYDRLPSLAAELVGRDVAQILPLTSHQRLRQRRRPKQSPLSFQRVPTRQGWPRR
jgi:putative ABC transport system substrate-binding protein